MIIVTSILGIIGGILFVIIACTYQVLLNKNESGFLHLLMTFMFLCWLPIPLVTYMILKQYDFLIVGALFGTVSLIIYITAMIMQTGHLAYTAKKSGENSEFLRSSDQWMLNGIGTPMEEFAGLLKGIWILFLTVAFWKDGQIICMVISMIYGVFNIVLYLFNLLDASIKKEVKLFKKIPINILICNSETVSWFLFLSIWMVIN